MEYFKWEEVEPGLFRTSSSENGFPETINVWEEQGKWMFSQSSDDDGMGPDTSYYLFNNSDDAKEWAERHYFTAGTDDDHFYERYKAEYRLK